MDDDRQRNWVKTKTGRTERVSSAFVPTRIVYDTYSELYTTECSGELSCERKTSESQKTSDNPMTDNTSGRNVRPLHVDGRTPDSYKSDCNVHVGRRFVTVRTRDLTGRRGGLGGSLSLSPKSLLPLTLLSGSPILHVSYVHFCMEVFFQWRRLHTEFSAVNDTSV